jgi:hypothetical protein
MQSEGLERALIMAKTRGKKSPKPTIRERQLENQIRVLESTIAKQKIRNSALISAGQEQDSRLKQVKDSIRLHQVESAVQRALTWRHTHFALNLWFSPPSETEHGRLRVDHEFPGSDFRRVSGAALPMPDEPDLRESLLRSIGQHAQGLDFAPVKMTEEKPQKQAEAAEDSEEDDE